MFPWQLTASILWCTCSASLVFVESFTCQWALNIWVNMTLNYHYDDVLADWHRSLVSIISCLFWELTPPSFLNGIKLLLWNLKTTLHASSILTCLSIGLLVLKLSYDFNIYVHLYLQAHGLLCVMSPFIAARCMFC